MRRPVAFYPERREPDFDPDLMIANGWQIFESEYVERGQAFLLEGSRQIAVNSFDFIELKYRHADWKRWVEKSINLAVNRTVTPLVLDAIKRISTMHLHD